MPLEILEHVYVGLVLEHLCKSFDCSCMAESLFEDIDIFVIDSMSNESYIVLDCRFTPTKHKGNSAQIF